MWVQIIISLVFMALSYALRPKPPGQKPAALQDVQAPTAEVGRPIPVVFGTVRVTGPNCTWFGDLSFNTIKKSGGK